jgi:hypothetical protein
LRDVDGHVALRIGLTPIGRQRDNCAEVEVRLIHHEIIADQGVESGRATEDELILAL